MEMKAVKNDCNYDVMVNVSGEGFTKYGQFVDCEFGRWVFQSDDRELCDYFMTHFEAADEVSICDLPSMLKVFRSAFEERDALIDAEMAAEKASDAAVMRYFEEAGWEDTFIEQDMMARGGLC